MTTIGEALSEGESSMHSIIDVGQLTTEEHDLIRAAAHNQGVLEVVMRPSLHGWAVVAGQTKFVDRNDPTVAQRHISLLVHLKEMELLREVANKKAYELTNFGWQFSRKLGR
jgi:hypothetical protein